VGWLGLFCCKAWHQIKIKGVGLTASVSPSASYLETAPQVTKGACSWFGPSFVGVPSLRSRTVGPPPSAVHGGGRLSRHPCRSAHYARPAFSLHPSRDWRCLGFCVKRSTATARATVDCDLYTGSVGAGLLANAFIQPPSTCRSFPRSAWKRRAGRSASLGRRRCRPGKMTRSAGCMHLSAGAGLLANPVVLLWACLLDVDPSHAPRGTAALDAPRHLDDADAGLGK
jgi:hypothetical protein